MVKKSDKEILKIVADHLQEMLGLNKFAPKLLKLFRYPAAIPQYEASSAQRLEAIRNLEKKYPGLYLAGGIRDGIGMADRVKQSYELSSRIDSNL